MNKKIIISLIFIVLFFSIFFYHSPNQIAKVSCINYNLSDRIYLGENISSKDKCPPYANQCKNMSLVLG